MSGARLFVVFPLYYTVPVAWLASLLYLDKGPMVGCTLSKGVYIVDAMARLVDEALKAPDWDRLIVWEHDVLVPSNALRRIARYTDEHPIVGSMIYTHLPPYSPYVFTKSSQPGLMYDALTPEAAAHAMNTPGLYECDAIGMGFTSIARFVLQEWKPDVPMWRSDKMFHSHDLWFCHYAAQQGHRIFFDSAMQCAHLTEVSVDVAHHRHAFPIEGAEVPELSALDGEIVTVRK